MLSAGSILIYIAINVAIFGGGFAALYFGVPYLYRKLKEYVK